MIPRTERHLIIRKLLSGGACLLLLVTWLSGIPLCGAGNNEIAVSQLEDERLEPGKPIGRKLAGGEMHSYRVTLGAGQFLQVIIEEQGIETVITLFGPDSNQIIKIDGLNGKPGSKLLQAVAEYEGDYGVEVRAMEKQSPAGKYVIKIEGLRVATLQNRKQFAADLTFAAASRFEEKQKALDYYNKSLLLSRDLKARRIEALTLYRAALTAYSANDLVEARANIKAALEIIESPRAKVASSELRISYFASLLRSEKEVRRGDGKQLPRLPFSRKEALAIFALGQQAGAMNALDFNATREIATSAEIGQYRIVHFATHSLLNMEG